MALAAICFGQVRLGDKRLPWAWLGAFGLVDGVNEWLSLYALSVGCTPSLSALRMVVMLVSFVLLAEFGRLGLQNSTGKGPGRWIHLPLLACVMASGFGGWDTAKVVAGYAYGLAGATAAVAAVWAAARECERRIRRPLIALSSFLGVYAISAGLVVPTAALAPAAAVSTDWFVSTLHVAAQLIRGILAASCALAVHVYSVAGRDEDCGYSVREIGLRVDTLIGALLALVLAAGWMLTYALGRQKDLEVREYLLARCRSVIAGVRVEQFASLDGAETDLKKPAYWEIRRHLLALRKANPDCRCIYTMGLRRNKVVFLVDSESFGSKDFCPPGMVYAEASVELKSSFVTRQPVHFGPMTDSWGTWVSTVVPADGTRDREAPGAVGMDIEARDWAAKVGHQRLLGIGITLLVCMLLAVLSHMLRAARESAERIAASEGRLRAIVERASDAIFVFDGQMRFVEANPRTCEIVGYTRQELLGMSVVEVTPAEDVESLYSVTDELLRLGHLVRERRIRRGDGGIVDCEISSTVLPNGQMLAIGRDISERKESEKAQRIQTSAINAATDQIVITDAAGKIVFVNPAFEAETGYSLSEAVGNTPRFLMPSDDGADMSREIWTAILAGSPWTGETTGVRKDGSTYVEETTVTPVRDDSGQIGHFVAIKRNITDKKAYEEELDHLAHHDPLTGLPNRLLFSDRLNRSIAQARRNDDLVAVLFLDLDGFKLINDTMGHNVGDILLWHVAGRLAKQLREADTIARMGGDEFTVILSGDESPETVSKAVRRILEVFADPFVLGGREVFVSTSIGIGMFPRDGVDVETLVMNADTAMYRAKEQGRGRYQFFTEELNVAAMEKMNLESDIRGALQRDEFHLHYQPQVDIKSGRILGVEALIRWQHPTLGPVSPAQFIPLAEETGLIVPISDWVLRTACAQNKHWQELGYAPVEVAVNISACQLEHDSMVETVTQTLAETGLDPRYLGLEVTESTIMRNPEHSSEILGKLKEMGARIHIDDFGTGHSSLSHLKRLPIDTVKIDQSFIRDITTNADDAAIASAVVAMSHSLKLKVIAEGVETLQQLEFLRSIRCDQIQGYFISRPVPAEDLEELFRADAGDQSMLPAA